MLEYRYYLIARNGHVSGAAIETVQPDDWSALKAAKAYVDGHDVEVWQEARLVAYLTPDKEG
jgi:hypothetical protein